MALTWLSPHVVPSLASSGSSGAAGATSFAPAREVAAPDTADAPQASINKGDALEASSSVEQAADTTQVSWRVHVLQGFRV